MGKKTALIDKSKKGAKKTPYYIDTANILNIYFYYRKFLLF